MLKKSITYTNFDDEEVTEDHFFHMSKAELVELEMSQEGGFSSALERIIEDQDGKVIIAEFKKIILGAYGKKSPDGKRFIKNQEIRDEFESTEAYSALFMELCTNADSAAEFVNGVVPKGVAEEAAKLAAGQKTTKIPDEPAPPVLAPVAEPVAEPEVVSRQQLMVMGTDEVAEVQRRLAAGEVVLGD